MAAPTAFTKSILPAPNALTGVALTMNACDNTNGNSITATGTEILVVYNGTVGALTFTITGVNDPYGRGSTGGNFSMSVPASADLTHPSAIITPRLATQLWSSGGLIQTPTGLNAALFVGVITGT